MTTQAPEAVWNALYKAGVEWGSMSPYVDAALIIQSRNAEQLTLDSLVACAEYVAHVAAAMEGDPEMVPSVLYATQRLLEAIK